MFRKIVKDVKPENNIEWNDFICHQPQKNIKIEKIFNSLIKNKSEYFLKVQNDSDSANHAYSESLSIRNNHSFQKKFRFRATYPFIVVNGLVFESGSKSKKSTRTSSVKLKLNYLSNTQSSAVGNSDA
jgi:hypothetical protein